MEKKSSHPQQQQHKQFILNLKHLPPIDPSITLTRYQMKKDNPNVKYQYVPRVAKPGPTEGTNPVKKFDHEANTKADLLADTNLGRNIETEDDDSSVKDIYPNDTINSQTKVHETGDDRALHKDSGGPKSVSAKSQLHEVCAANKWKPPLFECCKEEGPDYSKLFTYRVIIEIEESSLLVECFGAPRSKKKTAAEHAAEGALWYLKHLGYFPIKSENKLLI